MHTNMLSVVKCLLMAYKVEYCVDFTLKTSLTDKAECVLAYRHQILLGDSELSCRVQEILLDLGDDDTRADVADYLQRVEAQTAETEEEDQLGRLELASLVNRVVRCGHCVSSHCGFRWRYTCRFDIGSGLCSVT